MLFRSGRAAYIREQALLKRPIETVQLGTRIYQEGCPGFQVSKWVTVLSVEPYTLDSRMLDVKTTGDGMICEPGHLVRMAFQPEDWQKIREECIAYQARLTKQGKERKR